MSLQRLIFEARLLVIGSLMAVAFNGAALQATPANPTVQMKLKNTLKIPVKIGAPTNVKTTPNKVKQDFKSMNAQVKGLHFKTPARVTPETRAKVGARPGAAAFTDKGFMRKPGLLGNPNPQGHAWQQPTRAERHGAAAAKVQAQQKAQAPARRPTVRGPR